MNCKNIFSLKVNRDRKAPLNASTPPPPGIRKVLGVSVSGIVLLLSKEFTKWVILANIIAWIAMNS